MLAGTSPSITAEPNGTYSYAFQANTGGLWVNGVNFKLGMMAGTSPSITTQGLNGYEVAYQANTGILWLASPGGAATNTGLAMLAGTSPGIAELSTGGYAAVATAPQCPDTCIDEFYVDINGTLENIFSLGGAPTSSASPSVTSLANGVIDLAFEDGLDYFYLYQSDGQTGGSTQLAMKAGTNPSITTLQ
jgi:hypothetical protein